MLTDIFSRRYIDVVIRQDWSEYDRRFMVQAVSMLRDVLWQGPHGEKTPPETEAAFKAIHDIVALELGHEYLSDRYWWHRYTHNGNQMSTAHTNTFATICKNYLVKPYDSSEKVDQFLKDRLSLVEQGFRYQWNIVNAKNIAMKSELFAAKIYDKQHGEDVRRMGAFAGLPTSSREERLKSDNQNINQKFNAAISELNERLRLAQYPLEFHNGYLQMAGDSLTANQVHKPFWSLVADPTWANVDLQMKEAIDRRDNGDRTAAFHAVSALESVIKIISGVKGWTHGSEKGAANYIENLSSKKNRFIEAWEADMLKAMFSDVRNPFAHGPGQSPMPTLTKEQTNWALDTAMSWANCLIRRMR